MSAPIDLRSDTVTRPDAPMLEAMRVAPLGDDVFGDDPTVHQLEATAASLLGKEASLFVPTGTMANSIAIGLAADPGDEALVEASAHSFHFEVAGISRLWGVMPNPIPGDRGVVSLDVLGASVLPSNIHLPKTTVVILEQTANLAGGRVLPLDYLQAVGRFCRQKKLHFHLDGARIFNAAVASGVPARDYAACADTVMFCVSKGLGAPAGSLLVGSAAHIEAGRRLRKLLGGGMRQAGVLAAAGLYALEHNVERLAEDHAAARQLAAALRAVDGDLVEPDSPESNMLYLRGRQIDTGWAPPFVERLADRGVLAVALGNAVRFVFHKDVAPKDVDVACDHVVELVGALK